MPSEEVIEQNRFDRVLSQAVAAQHELKQELITLSAQVAQTTSVKDEYAKRISVLEGIVAGLVLKEPESIIHGLRALLRDDAPAVAEALRALVRTAVRNDNFPPGLW